MKVRLQILLFPKLEIQMSPTVSSDAHRLWVALSELQLAEKMIYPKQVQPICENNDNPHTRPQTYQLRLK